MTKEKRHASVITLRISRETNEMICTEISIFRTRLQALAGKDRDR